MADPEQIAKVVEYSGASTAIVSAGVWFSGVSGYMIENWGPICGYGGLFFAACGFVVNLYYQHARLKNEVRQKRNRRRHDEQATDNRRNNRRA